MVGAVSSQRNVAHGQDTWSVIWIGVMWRRVEGLVEKAKMKSSKVYDLSFNVSLDQFY